MKQQNPYSDLIAAFKGPIQKVRPGARTLTEAEVRRACGYSNETQTVYLVFCRQETGEECTEKVPANNPEHAYDIIHDAHPEWSVLGVRPYYV